ncbi:MAG: helix-turn-helix transcriptional regulator [Lachnospiraceae bacterium]|nr:helix-turn-helix transcriptional regulator [Lachnospiraceae bacterium]
MDYIRIGNKIRKLRLDRNLTQETFSEAIGISVSYIGQLERGQRNPSISTLESIAKTLEVPLSALLCNLTEEEKVSCIWKQKTENLSTKEKETLLRVLEMVLDLAITRQS